MNQRLAAKGATAHSVAPGAGSGSEATNPLPERGKTDESLRTEREDTDEALAETRIAVEEDADKVVENARVQADTVLDKARDKADDKNDAAAPGIEGKAVAQERVLADKVLQSERAAADERLRREREGKATVAAALLLEREKTDRYLLTERARSDDALAHRDDFLGMVSHDLRNLLNGIVLHATVLSAKASESEEGRRTVEGMERIQRYVARMNRLIGDLIDVTSIDAGKLAVRPQRGDVAALLTEAVDMFAHSADEKGISLVAEPVERPLPADFDHDRMLQVLINLISNALKFTPRGGAVTVRSERIGHELGFCVRDTGTGIPGNMLEAVFARFWQVGKNDQRGLGLGLYISRCIVEAHGGSIRAESKLGEGSAFHVTIP